MLRLAVLAATLALPLVGLAATSPLSAIQAEIDGFVHCSLDKAREIADGQSAPEDIADVATRACRAQFLVLRDAFAGLIKANAGSEASTKDIDAAASSTAGKMSISTKASIVRLVSSGKISPRPTKGHAQKIQTLGNSQVSALEVCKPEGERESLNRLVCDGGEHPSYERIGSVGSRNPAPIGQTKAEEEKMLLDSLTGRELQPGDIDYHTVDEYQATCSNYQARIYFDMYHCGARSEIVAPLGFTINP